MDEEKEMIKLYKKGLTLHEVASRLGVSQTTVYRKLKERDISTNKVTDEMVDKWVELYQEGKTQKEIAEKYDVSQSTVSRIFREKGIDFPGQNQKVSEETVDEWIELYQEGLSQYDIAKRYGVDQSSVSWRLRRRGIKSSKVKVTEEMVEEWIDLKENGLSCKEIAEEYDVNRSTVSKRLKETPEHEKMKPGNMKITSDIIDEWVDLYEEGMTQEDIAEKYGVAQSTVSRRLSKRNRVETLEIEFTQKNYLKGINKEDNDGKPPGED